MRPAGSVSVTVSVTAVSADDLAKSGIVSTAQLPQLVTGLTWGGQGPWTEPSLRAVTTTVASPGSGSPIAVYLDGVYQPIGITTTADAVHHRPGGGRFTPEPVQTGLVAAALVVLWRVRRRFPISTFEA